MYNPMHSGDFSQHEIPAVRSHENESMGNVYAKSNVSTLQCRMFMLCYAVKCIKYIFGNHFAIP